MTVLTFPLQTLFPAFSKLNSDSEELRRLFKLSVKYVALLIVPASIALATLSKELITLLYGPGYGLAPMFLTLYALTFLHAGLGSPILDHFFSGIGRTGTVFKWNLIHLSIFLPLGYTLTMLYGASGLIVALLVSSAFPLSYGLLIAKREFRVSLDTGASLRIYIASSISALPTLVLLRLSPFNSLVNTILGGLIFLSTYLTLSPLMGSIQPSDLDNFKLMFSKNRALWSIFKLLIAYEGKLLSYTFSRKS